jgi:hypothetical protein
MVHVDRLASRSTGPRRADRPWAVFAGFLCLGLLYLAVSACAGGTGEEIAAPPAAVQSGRTPRGGPRIVTPARPLECVPYAREASQVQIRGDAGTWWRQAEGRYDRAQRPAVGAALVLKTNGRSRGHLAVVTAILGEREIVVDHANWLNRGRVHLNTPVRDVSGANDWSAVRLWYTPGGIYGARNYAAHGFIYPRLATAAR